MFHDSSVENLYYQGNTECQQTALTDRHDPVDFGTYTPDGKERTMSCDARIRPLPNSTEVHCSENSDHTAHRGTLRDYAYPGSATVVEWYESDRRTFHGEWPGLCPGCVLPFGHRGEHAT